MKRKLLLGIVTEALNIAVCDFDTEKSAVVTQIVVGRTQCTWHSLFLTSIVLPQISQYIYYIDG